MTLRLHDTMARAVVPFEPLVPGRVALYACGPTIYARAHLGNFRTFLFEDLLRRWLEASGYAVFHVMNLTDVDDKTIRGAQALADVPPAAGETGLTPLRRFTAPFERAFHEDRAYLRILDAHAYPRATDYIAAQVALVESLLAKGVAYRADDGSVYFGIARWPAYGRLSRLDTREVRAGASGRTSADEYDKADAQDFVLWKAARPEDERVGAAWDAPFGRGRPGWHLECSAMALALLEERFPGTRVLDIHAGGVDLVFPHHEDEIAQSCAHTGEAAFARYWLHGEFLQLRGTKMSKRHGNYLTAADLREQGVDPGAVRLLVFGTHYRQALDWTDAALDAAREGSRRLGRFRDRLAQGTGAAEGAAWEALAGEVWGAFAAALDEDLNAPQALAAMFGMVSRGNALLDAGEAPTARARDVWRRMDAVLAVCPSGGGVMVAGTIPGDGGGGTVPAGWSEVPPAEPGERLQWAAHWAALRGRAKAARDFPEADRIRALLRAGGYEVRDRPGGAYEVEAMR